MSELVLGFVAKPWVEKRRAIRNRLKQGFNRVLPGVAIPMRLPFGAWWLAGDDICSDRIFAHRFEPAEQAFVDRYLRPGMSVLDIGAHHGLYSLLASVRVGPGGQVVSFEPSERERARLTRHLRMNRCHNVRVEPVALGSHEHVADLHRVDGRETGCNSLRAPDCPDEVSLHAVPIRVLDEYCASNGIGSIDLIKIDVEGGELDVFKGARELLSRHPRPVILAEVSDVRTAPWGYPAHDVVDLLEGLGYRWYAIGQGGALEPASLGRRLNDNLVAAPPERLASLPLSSVG